MPVKTVDKMSWGDPPREIRLGSLELLLHDGCSLANLAAVSREWRMIIEPHNFARIKLTMSRLADFGSILHRNRALVEYLWVCLELEEYDCSKCASEDPEACGIRNEDNTLIFKAIHDLFSALSKWEPHGDLFLDIGVYSPSDSKHRFKYLAFKPETPLSECDRHRCAEQAVPSELDNYQHGKVAERRHSAPAVQTASIYKHFEVITSKGPSDAKREEDEWWEKLPSVPAVTGVLLRQQNRRRWKPVALVHLLNHFPRLQEIHYEPWREWYQPEQQWTDTYHSLFFYFLGCDKLRKLILFENLDEQYSSSCFDCDPIRLPDPDVSMRVVNASLKLEHLSASFMVDASYFFDACKPSLSFPNLTSLVLTSQLLTPDECPSRINKMLEAAAIAAMKMPKLESMEIWNGREGLAMLFSYHQHRSVGGGQRAVVTWRGTWRLTLQPPAIQAWEAVARKHGSGGFYVIKEPLDADTVIKSHGDAIHYLNISKPVIQPISLQQIRTEHKIREGVHSGQFNLSKRDSSKG